MFEDPPLPQPARPTAVPVDRLAAGGRVRHDDHLPVLAEAASALTGVFRPYDGRRNRPIMGTFTTVGP